MILSRTHTLNVILLKGGGGEEVGIYGGWSRYITVVRYVSL